MNREVRRLGVLILLMFAALFVASSIIQVFQSSALAADSRNQRAQQDSYKIQRGEILAADGTVIAASKPSDDDYHWQRTYPKGALYSAVTGYYPVNGEPTGIEAALDGELAGTSGDSVFARLKSVVTNQDPKGDLVQVTIEPKVQQAADKALGNLQGAVVALNPKTGAVLAMVSHPDFDPSLIAVHGSKAEANYEKLLNEKPTPLLNRALADLNPPGSTFKLVVASAALESGKYSPSSSFPSPLSYTLPGTSLVIHNSGGEACGSGSKASIATALKYSCNIPFAQLGVALGGSTIADQAAKFGFGKSLDIPLSVATSSYPTLSDPSYVAQSAFGQYEDKATALQMAMVSSAIANGGALETPQLVQKVLSPSLDTVSQPSPTLLSQAVSSGTASTMTAMMVADVEGDGAASNAKMSGVQVAGKTGTAQNGTNDPYTLWFTGFAPADDPQVAVAVVLENGGGLGQQGYGNLLAAPIAKQVMEAVLNR